MDFYRVLNVSRGVSSAELKVAYRKLAKLYHPDTNPSKREESEIKFKAINHAYHSLIEEVKREEELREARVRANRVNPPQWHFRQSTHFKATPEGVFNVKSWNAFHYGNNPFDSDSIRLSSVGKGPMRTDDPRVSKMYARELQREAEQQEARMKSYKESVNQAGEALRAKREQRLRNESKVK